MLKTILQCPSCKHKEPIESLEHFRHNGVFYAPCPKCKNHNYLEKITFLRQCYFCGSDEGIVEYPIVDPSDGEWTSRKVYICYDCGAKEGSQNKRRLA